MAICESCGNLGKLRLHEGIGKMLCDSCRERTVLRSVAEYMTSRPDPAPETCYRCWQVGRDGVRATCVVVYSVGTPNEWRAKSCLQCAELDTSRFPSKTRVVMRLVEKGKP